MSLSARARGLFCNRTLNLRSIKAIGYDMDYTLVHYHIEAWERRAYAYLKEGLQRNGWPVEDLEFEPDLSMRGLIVDLELGNIVKANRFGYVKQAYHGTAPLDFDTQRATYSRILIDLKDRRWRFLNTFFSLSESCMYMQLVDRYDAGQIDNVLSYEDLYRHVRKALDFAHMEGRLKAEIAAKPDGFIDFDPEMPLALLDQKHAGKAVLLITNSELTYAAPMLTRTIDPYLPDGMTWRELFDLSLFGARKPDFFESNMPVFSVVDETGLLREHGGHLERGQSYVGGNASLVEESLGLSGEQILYVGDHIFTDINVSKKIQRWRTALIVRELEDEVTSLEAFENVQSELSKLMEDKRKDELALSKARLRLQRLKKGYGPPESGTPETIEEEITQLREGLRALDDTIAPLAKQAALLNNSRWGLLMRTGRDKSHLAQQIERYADIYTSRVSNFMHRTPYEFIRSPRQSMPHDDLR